MDSQKFYQEVSTLSQSGDLDRDRALRLLNAFEQWRFNQVKFDSEWLEDAAAGSTTKEDDKAPIVVMLEGDRSAHALQIDTETATILNVAVSDQSISQYVVAAVDQIETFCDVLLAENQEPVEITLLGSEVLTHLVYELLTAKEESRSVVYRMVSYDASSDIKISLDDLQGYSQHIAFKHNTRYVKHVCKTGHNNNVARVKSDTSHSRGRKMNMSERVLQLAGFILNVEPSQIDTSVAYSDLGFSSVQLTEFAITLTRDLGVDISPVTLFDYHTIALLTNHIENSIPQPVVVNSHEAPVEAPTEAPKVTNKNTDASPLLDNMFDSRCSSSIQKGVAIIGISGQFPGADDINEFWRCVEKGENQTSKQNRWSLEDIQSRFSLTKEEAENLNGGFISGVDYFDAEFFGISPKEAQLMDPQQRLILANTWKAIEDSGHSPDELRGSDTTVYIGVCDSGYGSVLNQSEAKVDAFAATGLSKGVIANRVSYCFDLNGDSQPVDAGCASSLVAIKHACASIQNGATNLAIAGGVNVILSPETHVSLSKAGLLSETGRCHSFSDEADGFVRSEGVGVILLKNLEDAIRDNDHIYGVIRAVESNHNGNGNSLTSPNSRSQARVIQQAYEKSGIDPNTVGAVEAHATGTDLGDAIEFHGLSQVFNANDNTCAISTLKPVFGHLEIASGMASLFKAILQIKNKKRLRMPLDGKVNNAISVDRPLFIPENTEEWPAVQDSNGRDLPRRAGINAFGFSGVNSHLVLEEHVSDGDRSDSLDPELIILSARNIPQLKRAISGLKEYVSSDPAVPLRNIAYTLQCGRRAMACRVALSVKSVKELYSRLEHLMEGKNLENSQFFNHCESHSAFLLVAEQPEMNAMIKRWFSEQEFEKIAALWRDGFNIHWAGFWNSQDVARISLPTYSFEKRAYWPPGLSPLSEDIPDTNSNNNVGNNQTENDTYTRIKRIWSEILGVQSISPDNTFFEVGGHSIFVAQVITKIEDQLGVRISQRTMFEKPTLSELVAIVEIAIQNDKHNPSVVQGVVEAQGEKHDFPMALEQNAYWFFYELEGSSATYNIPFITKIKGRLNVSALERSINTLLNRHEVLRTTIKSSESGVVQNVVPHKNQDIQVVTIYDSELSDMLDSEVQRNIVLEKEIPFRVKLFKYADKQEYVLSIIFHHATMDGWSLGIFVKELSYLYREYSQENTPELDALPITYSDYAHWQNTIFIPQQYKEKLDYWKTKLSGLPPVLDLPTDYTRPPVQSYRGATEAIALPNGLTDRLRQFAQKESTTLYNVLLSALALLMSKYSRSDDVPIGTAVANRPYRELENIVGCFANAVVVRCGIDDKCSFKELLENTSKTSLEAFENAEVPFDAVVDAVKPERSLGVPPIFQVMFRLHNHDMGWGTQLEGVEIAHFEYNKPTAELDLNIALRETENGIVGEFNYATDLFSKETIERFISHYTQLLSAAVSSPTLPVNALSMLTEAERKQIELWNDTDQSYDDTQCNHYLFEKVAAAHPDKEAYVCGDDRFTYGELNQKANRIANWLQSQGVKCEDRVGLSVGKSSWMGVGTLAILKSGGTFVPLDPFYPEERLQHMMEVAKPTVILTDSSCVDRVPESDEYKVVVLDDDSVDWSSFSDENPTHLENAEHSAYILFTSGSTGKPKGILVAHKSWRNMTLAHSVRGLSNPDNAILQFASVSFAVSLWGSFMAWAVGGKLVQVTDEESLPGEPLYSLLERENVTTVTWPVSLLSVVPIERIPACLHTVISSAEPCNDAVVARWTKDSQRRFLNIYGNSEVSMGSSLYEYHSVGQKLTIGTPLPNTQMYLLDDSLQLVPPGVIAEIFTGGVGLARGYVDQEEKTAEKFIPNPYTKEPGARLYRTGDLGRYLPNGEIEFIGREDFQVSVRGFRVELNEVEGVLRENASIDDLAVVARPDASGVDRLVCFYVLKNNTEKVEHKTLRKLVEKKLPNYMVPSLFVELDEMPLTPNRKVDRLNLQVPNRTSDTVVQLDSQNSTINTLIELWKDVLELESLTVHDNFFELGGHSLLAAHLTSKIEAQFDRKLPVKILFDAPTISELAKALDNETTTGDEETLHLTHHKCRSPIVMLPGVGGGVLNFYETAKTLNAHHEVIALSFNDVYQQGPQSVETVAAKNIEKLESMTNLNDVTIIGHSFGGWVAYEMVKQMQERGIRVNALVFIDSLSPVITRKQIDAQGLEHFVYNAALGLLGGEIFDTQESLASLDDIKHSVEAFFGNTSGAPTKDKMRAVVDLVYNQLHTPYVPGDTVINCPMLAAIAENGFGLHDAELFKSALGWQPLVSKNIHNEIVTGDHFSILHEENAARLSRTITDWLSLCDTLERKDVQILRKSSDTEQEGSYQDNASGVWEYERPFVSEVDVSSTEIDYLGHVSHVVYMSWVGMVTWAHNRELNLDWTLYDEKDSAMAILKHDAEYLLPVTNGEKIKIATWCTECDKRFRLQRKYQVIRERDNKTVFRCTTDYACISIKSGRPKRMPAEFKDAYDKYFSWVPEEQEALVE